MGERTPSGSARNSKALDTREQILICARDEFVQGPGPFSLRAVARRVGITPMAIYRHFANKEALWEALVAEGFKRLRVCLQGALTRRSPRARLKATWEAYLDFAENEPRFYELLFAHPLGPKAQARTRTLNATTFRMLVDRVREAIEADVVQGSDPKTFALDLWAQLHGLVALHHNNKFGLTQAQFRAHCRSTCDRWLK